MSVCLLFPAELLEVFDERNWGWGHLNLRIDEAQGVVTVAQARHRDTDEVQRFDGHWSDTRHYLRYADIKPYTAVWYRADPGLHLVHDQLRRRSHAAIPTEFFRSLIPSGWVNPGALSILVVAVTTPSSGWPDVSVWRVDDHNAVPESSSIVDSRLSPLDTISDVWPTKELSVLTATIVGVGSIGSAIADALARNGVGHLNLVDHDRLEQRNLSRHRLTDRDLGRYKVDAMKDHLQAQDGAPAVEAHRVDIITDTDILRPMVANSDIVVCAADGVAARRVCNHVARRARRPLVLAAVLEDGAFGEIIRVRSRTGCLFCLRLQQDELGLVNPEPNIDLGYGMGTTHRPMTAAPGDLDVVAQLAAKVTISTLLERRGRWNQRLPGDFAVIGLQPKPDYTAPFDMDRAGDVRWYPLPEPRPDCPTCRS
jgi:molybdopterin/thiamine biosynthesis adenylyltransferase